MNSTYLSLNEFYHLSVQPVGATWTKEEAYAYCRGLTLSHYENFPVGSMLMPKKVRPHVYAIYAFARVSDDFADEAAYKDPSQRLALLEDWQRQLENAYQGKAEHPIFMALADTAEKLDLPMGLFSDLLHAFKRDVTVSRYQTFEEVIHDYCRYSANPVGRLILYLFGYRDEERLRLSDHICTALQLTNFWQDVDIDLKKDRIYIPIQEMEVEGYSVDRLIQREYCEEYVTIMTRLAVRTWELFEQGYPLVEKVHFPLSAELRCTWLGGVEILSRTWDCHFNVFTQRPKLTKFDFINLGFRSLFGVRGIKEKKNRLFVPIRSQNKEEGERGF